jgi:hypothetical protein
MGKFATGVKDLCLLMEGSGAGFRSVQIFSDPNPGGPKITDPDPEHWLFAHDFLD